MLHVPWIWVLLLLLVGDISTVIPMPPPPPPPPLRFGQVVSHTVTHSGLHREYLTYMPSASLTTPPPLVLLVTLHCYGGSAEQELSKYVPVAETHGLALLSPQGVSESWNAGQCCGEAKARRLDDAGFIATTALLTLHAINESYPLTSFVVYATGFSNGGFMASELMVRVPWVRGGAPVAGHRYDALTTLLRQPLTPKAVFLHHSLDDHMVAYSGCCSSSSSSSDHTHHHHGCCCGIHFGSTCVSTTAVFQRWAKANRCAPVQQQQQQEVTFSLPDVVTCWSGVHCLANTTLCAYHNVEHAEWSLDFPYAGWVGEFVARDACEAAPLHPYSAAAVALLRADLQRGLLGEVAAALLQLRLPSVHGQWDSRAHRCVVLDRSVPVDTAAVVLVTPHALETYLKDMIRKDLVFALVVLCGLLVAYACHQTCLRRKLSGS